MTVSEFCKLHDACSDGRKWAMATGCKSMAELWGRDDIRPEWRLWIATRDGVLDDKTLRLFSVFCARQCEHLLTDQRSRNAIAVAERYANGQATREELAEAAAWAVRAAAEAVMAAAEEADWAAAEEAAWAAAWEVRAAQSNWLRDNARPLFEKGGGG